MNVISRKQKKKAEERGRERNDWIRKEGDERVVQRVSQKAMRVIGN